LQLAGAVYAGEPQAGDLVSKWQLTLEQVALPRFGIEVWLKNLPLSYLALMAADEYPFRELAMAMTSFSWPKSVGATDVWQMLQSAATGTADRWLR